MESLGKLMVLMGLLLAAFGLLVWFGGAWKLPGDILIRRGNFTFYFPLATSIILSLVLTLILNFFFSGRR
jgi:uncharacterized membrane protein YidH (DUF202 family)